MINELDAIKERVDAFVLSVNTHVMSKHPYADRLSVIKGKRYYKVVTVDKKGFKSAWCFIDSKGNILKPACWSRPAKHRRGSIFKNEAWNQVSWTGPMYLRS